MDWISDFFYFTSFKWIPCNYTIHTWSVKSTKHLLCVISIDMDGDVDLDLTTPSRLSHVLTNGFTGEKTGEKTYP